jgi:hypothetical protein
MQQIHCHACGGFITDATAILYEAPLERDPVAQPSSALCLCQAPIIYGAPPGYASSPGMPAIDRPDMPAIDRRRGVARSRRS